MLVTTPTRRRRTPTRRSADRLFDELWHGFARPAVFVAERPAGFVPQVDVSETEDAFRVTAELPGVAEDDFEVVLEDGVLLLKGEKKARAAEEGSRYRRAESASGRFERRLRFGDSVDPDAVTASYREGVLEVVLGKPEEAKPRVIQVPIETS